MKQPRNYTHIDARMSNFIQRKLASINKTDRATTTSRGARVAGLDYEALSFPTLHQ